jgi:hypothetical protein
MTKVVKVICIKKCNSYSYSNPEWIIYDRGEQYQFYDNGYEYHDFNCDFHRVSKSNFITLAEWRDKQIDSILND